MADVRVIGTDGAEKTYPGGTKITRDGWGDFEIRDASDDIIATRLRASVREIEVIASS
jgi:hypothetical protein